MKTNIAFKQNTTNSRFSSLKDDIKEPGNNKDPRNNTQSRQQYVTTQRNAIFDEPKNNSFQRPTSFRDRIQAEKDKKQADLERSLKDKSSFPELVPAKTSEKTNNMNYINKLTWVKEEKEKEKIDDDWLPMGFEKLGQTNNECVSRPNMKSAPPHIIMKALDDLYQNWKKDYINTWGQDDYEHNYLFPNYDYEYFDKLDDKYEREMFKLEEQEREKEREMEYEYTDNYDD